jgi:hypothetical protein
MVAPWDRLRDEEGIRIAALSPTPQFMQEGDGVRHKEVRMHV